MTTFEELAEEALDAPFRGWDFSWLAARCTSPPLPWSYDREVAQRAARAAAMLDMGTGGGELLSQLDHRPARTVATEGWPPNVQVAARRLRTLGVPVVQDEGAADNMAEDPARGRLPFRDGAFDLVTNRHEAFRAAEVGRVLAPGGTFVTQQVDMHTYDDLYWLLGLPLPEEADSWLPLARQQLGDAGLTVTTATAGEQREQYHDVAAVIYYLRVVSWAVPEYSLDRFAGRLKELHETPGAWPVTIRQRRFLVIATQGQLAG
jgi:SAM-dependent methyltransferase